MTGSTISYVKVTLEATEPFRIADPDEAGLVDRPVVVNYKGAAEVPATGLIGSLRAHLPEDLTENILGSDKPSTAHDGALHPSPLRALGTRLRGPDGAEITNEQVRLVNSTAIDPRRGAADASTLRSAEEVPAGSRATLWCEYDGALPGALLDEMVSWSPVLGGGVGTGHGRTKLVEIASGTLDLNTTAGLSRYLQGIRPGEDGLGVDDILTPIDTTNAPADRSALVDLEAEIVDGLFTSGGVRRGEAEEQSHSNIFVPLQRDTEDGSEYVLEGSSIRGVLRARVAYIAASIFAAEDPSRPEDAIAKSEVICERLFGSVRHRGSVSVATSTITGHNGPVPTVEPRMHVGIDRFTGGALPGLLFGEEVITDGCLRLQIRALPLANALEPELTRTLLLAACRDIADGLVGVGGCTMRGYGTLNFVGGAHLKDLNTVLPLSAETVASLHRALEAPADKTAAPQSPPPVGAASPSDGNPLTTDRAETKNVVAAKANRTGTLVVHELGVMDRERCAELVTQHSMTAVWFDALDGMFVEDNLDGLDTLTVGTHLWAWSNGAWLRARIDNGNFHVAIAGDLSPAATATTTATEVAWVNEAIKWSIDEPRLSRKGRATMTRLPDRQWTLTSGTESPITFVHFGKEPPALGETA